MIHPDQCAQFMGEKEILQDGLISQKLIAAVITPLPGNVSMSSFGARF